MQRENHYLGEQYINMCLYPKIIRNQKYQKNSKNGGVIPAVYDTRVLHNPIGCGNCMECRKQKSREWQVRLMEDIKSNTNGQFVTLTFSNESIAELNEETITRTLHGYNGYIEKVNIKDLKGYDKDNAIAKKAVRYFLERWRKKHKVSVRHWLVTELGHKGTENIHLHGIIWTDHYKDIKDKWQYGHVWDGYSKTGKRINYVNEKTINYIVKYIHKIDLIHKEYKSKILTSAGIGRNYTEGKGDWIKNKYNGTDTKETYRTRQGLKIAMPKYWRNKIYTDEEKEQLWINKLDQNKRYVDGIEIDISETEEVYYKVLEEARAKNKILGYGDNITNWNRKKYEAERRDIINGIRIKKNTQ